MLLLIFHHCYRLADRIERYQVDLCGLTTEQLVAIAECCKICVAIFAFVSGYGLMYGYSAKMKNKEKVCSIRMDIRTSSFHYVRILVYCELYPILFTLDLDLRIRASGEKPFMKEDSPYLQIYWESPDFWRLKVLTGHGGI
ncbi:hypothetical protein M5E86_18875 [Blautia wexlerae]|nr:hypothetical protein M5E86_18875 [Blautia wexlerae]